MITLVLACDAKTRAFAPDALKLLLNSRLFDAASLITEGTRKPYCVLAIHLEDEREVASFRKALELARESDEAGVLIAGTGKLLPRILAHLEAIDRVELHYLTQWIGRLDTESDGRALLSELLPRCHCISGHCPRYGGGQAGRVTFWKPKSIITALETSPGDSLRSEAE